MMTRQIEMQRDQEIAMLSQQYDQSKWSNQNLIAQKQMELTQQATQMNVMSQQYELQKSMYEQYAKNGLPAAAMNPMASYVPPPATFAQAPMTMQAPMTYGAPVTMTGGSMRVL